MKKILLIFLILLTSCSINEYEKRLIGNWNNYPAGGRSDIKFYKDSVITNEYHTQRKGTWSANENEIKFHFPEKIKGFREFYTLDYQILNDTLLIKNKNKENFVIPSLFKVSDYWTHFLREIGLKISLPKADFPLIKNNSFLGINVYVGYKNDTLKVISSSREIQNEDDLINLILSEKAMRKENEVDSMCFNLIADKNVNIKTIDSLKNKLKTITEFKVFRVYENDTANYGKYDLQGKGELWNWYGRFE